MLIKRSKIKMCGRPLEISRFMPARTRDQIAGKNQRGTRKYDRSRALLVQDGVNKGVTYNYKETEACHKACHKKDRWREKD